MKAIGYIRVSTVEQACEGVSLDAQRRKIEAYCAANDIDLAEIVEDAGISAKNVAARPGLQSVLARLGAGEAQVLVVLKLDRLSRSTKDVLQLVEYLEKQDWQLHSITEKLDTGSAAGRFVLTILAALAQMEREQIGERTSMALQFKKQQGERLGTTPLGYTTQHDENGLRTLVPVETEQATLARIREMHESGQSYSAIARQLGQDGIPTKRGGRWWPATVKYVVEHEPIQRDGNAA